MKKVFLTSLVVATLLLASTAFAGSDELCYKSADTGWSCGTNPDASYASATGSVEYTDVSGQLEITVELKNMKPDFDYQLTLNGRNGKDGNVELGKNCPKPNTPATWYGYTVDWECGTWSGGEGFWNFDMDATTDASGYYKHTYHLALPIGHYETVGFIVKEAVSPWTPVLMEKSGLDWYIVGRSFEKEKIWDKLYIIQDEIAKITIDLGALVKQVEDYVKPKLLEIQTEITKLWDAMPECCCGAKKCEGDDRYECVEHKWQLQETCEWGCVSGACLPAPRENCNDNDDKYCANNDAVTEDWYCEVSFGSDDNCIVRHCKMDKTTVYCDYGCSNGNCNPPPTTTTTTIPDCSGCPQGTSWSDDCDRDSDCQPCGCVCKQRSGPDICVKPSEMPLTCGGLCKSKGYSSGQCHGSLKCRGWEVKIGSCQQWTGSIYSSCCCR